MIDHITFGVTDISASTEFYDQAFRPLGVRRLFDLPQEDTNGVKVTGYGDDRPWFWLAEERPASGLLHVALLAKSAAEVDAFYAEALRAGGTDNGPPGLRPHYHPSYYAAFVIDPEGHNIEAVWHGSPR